MTRGRKPDLRREAYGLRFGLGQGQYKYMSHAFMDQLDRCADDSARRVLLGERSDTERKRSDAAQHISAVEGPMRSVRVDNRGDFWFMEFDAPQPHQEQGFWWSVVTGEP